MEKKVTGRLCSICLQKEALSLGMCNSCSRIDSALTKLIENRPKQAASYLKKKFEIASKRVRNRFMSRPVGE